jgi:hypothetical protein
VTARKGPEERRQLRGEHPRSTAAAMLFAPCSRARASARRKALNGVFSLTVKFMPSSAARGTGCRRIAEPSDRPVTALRRKTRPFGEKRVRVMCQSLWWRA